MQNVFISCDWGTSSFRLKLVNADSGKIIDELATDEGCAVMYQKWNANTSADRLQFYLQYLKDMTDELSRRTALALTGATIVISGMASSSIGMKEIDYAPLPFAMDGSNAKAEWIDLPVIANKILLISGVRHPNDVMRGEETQLVGVAAMSGFGEKAVTYILPGTHSKHVMVKNKQIAHFKTYMTGEIFSVMTRCSILGQSVSAPIDAHIDDADREAFLAGVGRSGASNLLHSLFSVRVNNIDNSFSKRGNYFYLSGLCIGAELGDLQDAGTEGLIVCGGSKMHMFYKLALERLGLSDRATFVPSEKMDHAATAGQREILKAKTA